MIFPIRLASIVRVLRVSEKLTYAVYSPDKCTG